MKTRELKQLAEAIAKAELTLRENKDEQEVRKAKKDILLLSKRITSLEDMLRIDDMVQNILKKSCLYKILLIYYSYRVQKGLATIYKIIY